MTGLVLAGLLLGLAGTVWRGGSAVAARRRLHALMPRAAPPRRGARRPPLLAVAALGGVGIAVVVGGPLGAVTGVVGAVVVLRVVPRLESRAARSRRAALAAQAPDVLDLLAACLASGATIAAAVSATADAVPSPAADLLRQVGAELRLGADPVRAWAPVAAEEPLAPLAAAVTRSTDSGASLRDVLPAAADDLRAQRRGELEAAARKVGVHLSAPLGVAFLPAFVLLGVVPVVASLVTGVLVFP